MEKYAEEHGNVALFENILVPALSLAESDRHRGALDDNIAVAFETTRQIAEELRTEEEAESTMHAATFASCPRTTKPTTLRGYASPG